MRVGFLVTAVAMLLLPLSPASGATGDLTYAGCFATADSSCAQFPSGSPDWYEPTKVVATPDGSTAYAISALSGLVQLDRAADGKLSFARCLTANPKDSCDHLPSWADPISVPLDLAVSHDGRDIYVITRFNSSLFHFRVDGAGHVSFAGCFGPEDEGCDPIALAGGEAITISPDDRNVYTAGGGGVVTLKRDPATGDLVSAGCFSTSPQCTMPPRATGCPWTDCWARPIDVARAIVVSADGASVYVASEGNNTSAEPGAIAHFTRAADGSLAFHDCISGSGNAYGCHVASTAPLALIGNESVAVAPNGTDVYSTAAPTVEYGYADAAVHLRLDSKGDLALSNCIGEHVPGCTVPPTGDGLLRWPHSVVASADGEGAYVESGSAVTHFKRLANGDLGFSSCISELTGCVAPPIGTVDNQRMTLSPDGANLYALDPNRIVVFRRQQPTTPAHPAKPPAPPPAVRQQPATAVGMSQAILTGDVNPFARPTTYRWEYGPTTSYGSRFPAADADAGADSSFHEVSNRLTELEPGTTYHYRLVATSTAGTTRGRDLTFTTSPVPAPVPAGLAPVSEASASDRSTAVQVDAAHAGSLGDDALSGQLLQRWALTLGDQVSYPVIADRKVFVVAREPASWNYDLVALDADTGGTLWTYPITFGSGGPAPGLTYDNGSLFLFGAVGRGTKRLSTGTAFDPDTGAVKWTTRLGGGSAPPTATGGTLYTVSDGIGGLLMATRESDGARLWTASLMTGDRSSPAVGGGKVYVNFTSHAYAFGAADGKLAWHFGCGGCSGAPGRTPVLAGGKLFIRDPYTVQNYVLDAATGAQSGTYPGNPTTDPPPAISGSTMLLTREGALTARNSATGATLWSFGGDGKLTSAPVVVNGVVYVGSAAGTVYGVDLATGRSVWSTNAGAGVVAPDNDYIATGIGAGNGLLVVPAGGRLVAYSSPAGARPAPAATTDAATGVGKTGATLAGSVNPNGSATTYHFEWGSGSGTAYPNRAPASDGAAGAGSTQQSVSAALTGLSPATAYHYRLVATNCGGCAAGTAYGANRTFTTAPADPPPPAPGATTGAAASVGADGATLDGTVEPRGVTTTYRFDWGASIAYDHHSADAAAGSADTPQAVAVAIGSLSPSTTYHYRLVAVSAGGTAIGADRQFTTAASPPAGSSSPAEGAPPPDGDGSPPQPARPESAPPEPAPPEPVLPAAPDLTLGLSLARSPDLARLLRRGLAMHAWCSVGCRLTGRLVYRRGARAITLGRIDRRLRADAQSHLRVRLAAPARKLLAGASRAQLTIRLTAVARGQTVHLVRRLTAERRVPPRGGLSLSGAWARASGSRRASRGSAAASRARP